MVVDENQFQAARLTVYCNSLQCISRVFRVNVVSTKRRCQKAETHPVPPTYSVCVLGKGLLVKKRVESGRTERRRRMRKKIHQHVRILPIILNQRQEI